jgi:predicted transglutaminase-like cysteine proteinase
LFTSSLLVANQYFNEQNLQLILERVLATYDSDAKDRTHHWVNFLNNSANKNEWQKINLVNQYFNKRIEYQNDDQLWGKKDYWASPIETLARGAGDCEDFAIAKYFSLINLGVSEDKIRLMYVRQLTVNEPHMVLIYFESPGEVPFVLDNFNHKLLPASQRNDLKPIYSFNGQGLWLAKAKGLGRKIENSKGVSAWQQMIERIEQGELNTKESVLNGENYAKLN